MANEITLTFGLTLAKGNLKRTINAHTLQRDLTGAESVSNVQSVGTGAHEALVIGDMGTAGYLYAKNLDATNYVELGIDATGTFHPLIRLKAGDECLVPMTTTAVYAKANTGAVSLDYTFIEA